VAIRMPDPQQCYIDALWEALHRAIDEEMAEGRMEESEALEYLSDGYPESIDFCAYDDEGRYTDAEEMISSQNAAMDKDAHRQIKWLEQKIHNLYE